MKQVCITAMLAIFFCQAFAQSIFDNPITGINPNTANPYTAGQTVSPNLTASGIGRGTGITGSNTNNRYNATGWNSAALDANDYYEFILTPNAGSAINFISLAVTLQNSGTGPTNYALRSSKDAFTADIGTLVSNSTTGALNTVDLSAVTYQNINSAITFRIYAWGASSGTGSFSVNDFIFNGIAGLLPVTIEYFNGAKQNAVHALEWKINCSNEAGTGFILERSADGKHFIPTDTFSATALRCQQSFSYTDYSPLPGRNYYRLVITAGNGKIIFSNTILLLNATTGFTIANMQPSVVTTTAIVNISAAQKTPMVILVTDIFGRKLQQRTYHLIAGNNPLVMNFSTLAAGVYQLTGYTDDGIVAGIRFVKQ
jgi:hypothetical protein